MIKNVLEMLEESAGLYPEHNVFADEKNQISYSEFIKNACIIGSNIAQSGKRNRPIAVYMEKSVAALCTYFGAVYSGNFYVPIDVEMPYERVQKIFSVLNPEMVVVDKNGEAKFSETDYSGVIKTYEELMNGAMSVQLLKSIRTSMIDTDPVYALFTSGSTGIPKGVVVGHRSVIDYAYWIRETFQLNENTIMGNQTPFYFSMSVFDIYGTICSGGQLHIIPKKYFTFVAELADFLNVRKVNMIYWVPSALCLVANFKILEKSKLTYLKKILFAGEVMPTKQLNIWRKYIPDALYANLFGPTEITDIGIFYILNRTFKDDETIPIGNACTNVDSFILDESGKKILPDDQETVGELYFRGSFLAHGYYGDWEKTKTAFVQNPLNNLYPEIVYKTGDLVKWNSFGEMVYVSRKDFQIKHMGYRIELGEIEAAANTIDGMSRCACIYDAAKDRIILIYQTVDELSEAVVKKMMKKLLPAYMIPNRYLELDEMPLNSNGKIDRNKLKSMIREGKSYE